MKTLIELSVICSDELAGRGLGAVLAPDNDGAPRGLGLSMARQGKRVSLRLGSESHSTALSTTLAILGDLSLFEQVWLLSRAHNGQGESD